MLYDLYILTNPVHMKYGQQLRNFNSAQNCSHKIINNFIVLYPKEK